MGVFKDTGLMTSSKTSTVETHKCPLPQISSTEQRDLLGSSPIKESLS